MEECYSCNMQCNDVCTTCTCTCTGACTGMFMYMHSCNWHVHVRMYVHVHYLCRYTLYFSVLLLPHCKYMTYTCACMYMCIKVMQCCFSSPPCALAGNASVYLYQASFTLYTYLYTQLLCVCVCVCLVIDIRDYVTSNIYGLVKLYLHCTCIHILIHTHTHTQEQSL